MISKKILSLTMSLVLSLGVALGGNVQVASAVSVLDENETATLNNNDLDNAKFFVTDSLLKKTSYSYLQGSFYGAEDVADFYKFSTSKYTGSEGRFAIKMEGIPFGDNYNMYLLDKNGDEIAHSTRSGNNNEIIKIEEKANKYTDLYLMIVPVKVCNYETSNYRLIFDNYIATGSKRISLSPTQVTTKSNTWSTDVIGKSTGIPSSAVITKATISASKSSTVNGTNYKLRAKVGSQGYTQVNWASGDIELPGLVGQNASGNYFAGFTATEIPVKILNRYKYLGFVEMKNFKMNVNYEYDQLESYN